MSRGGSSNLIIDGLWRGASSQAPWARVVGQVEYARNVRFDITMNGAIKRGSTHYIAELTDYGGTPLSPGTPYFFAAIRGAIIAIGAGEIHAWDSDGVPLEVAPIRSNIGNNDDLFRFRTYVSGINPITDIDVATSYDTMVVTNRTVNPSIERGWTFQESYSYMVNGYEHFATPEPPVFMDTVEDFSEMPNDASDGDIYRTRADYEFDPSGYYIQYTGNLNEQFEDGYFSRHSGGWYRIPKADESSPTGPGQYRARYDWTTMPHRIIYDEDNNRVLVGECHWRHRLSGAEATNPSMPWSDGVNRIRAVEFHSGRLFNIGDGHITSGRSRDFYNPWINNVNLQDDSDPVVVSMSQSNVGRALRASSLGSSLLVVAENGQIDFGSGEDVLTNVNGRSRLIGDFQAQDVPLGSGPSSVVMVDKFKDVHQFRWVGEIQGVIYASLLTAHNREALYNVTPTRVYSISNTVFITTETGNMRSHDTFTIQNEMVQSAWNEMEFLDPCVFVNTWGGYIDVVTKSDTAYTLLHYVHRDEEPPTDLLYQPNMDHLELVQVGNMTYDEEADETSMYHSGRSGVLESSMLMTANPDQRHVFLSAKRIETDGAVVFPGQWNQVPQYLGFLFDCDMTLSHIYPAMVGYDISVVRIVMFHHKTAEYGMSWIKRDGTPVYQGWQAHKLGRMVLGEASLETHYREFAPAGGIDSKTDVTFSSRSPGPVRWTGVEVEYIVGGRGATM